MLITLDLVATPKGIEGRPFTSLTSLISFEKFEFFFTVNAISEFGLESDRFLYLAKINPQYMTRGELEK